MAVPRSRVLLAAVATGILAAGCGSGSHSPHPKAHPRQSPPAPPSSSTAPNGSSGRGQAIPTPGPTGVPADPNAVRVIRAWSTALRRGDVRDAARYFAFPSEFINGPDASGGVPIIQLTSLGLAEAVNASLPCGARLISTDARGRYVNALFRLTDRPGPGGGCGSGVGQLARTNFLIARGRIVEWIRAPYDPGDGQGGGSRRAAPTPPAPSPPGGSGPVI